MFGLASGLYQNYFVPPEVSCLIIGIDGAGKTALLERVKVTDFTVSRPPSTGKRIAVQKRRTLNTAPPKPQLQPRQSKNELNGTDDPVRKPKLENKPSPRRRRFACPSPSSYKQEDFDSDEETDLLDSSEDSDDLHRNSVIELPSKSFPVSPPSSPNNAEKSNEIPQMVGTHVANHIARRGSNIAQDQQEKEYDVIDGKTMLPLRLIRPTLGMNLGKLSACGAKVRLMDLGGSIKMRPLWERYYKDVHAITFVFDVSPSCEVSKLMEARAYYRCMRDDESLRNVPIMIFANKTDTRKRQQELVLDDEELDDKNLLIGDTSLLDIAELFLSPPRGMSTDSGEWSGAKDSDDYGDNGNISMFAGSAKTGEGVVAAFDWLIRKGAERVHQLRKSEEI